MPEISRFAGVIVYMLYMDTAQHSKPHVHVKYGSYNASIGIDGELLSGSLPIRQMKIVVGWLALNEAELYNAWNLAIIGKQFNKIKPLV